MVHVEGDYEIREPVLGDVLGILEKGGQEGLIGHLLRHCVYKNGQLLGDAVDQLPLAEGLRLATEMARVSGLSAPEGNA